jgi:hypothetical protein
VTIEDVRARLRLDERRLYLAGFSGGARAATVFAAGRAVRFAGVVAGGAGLSEDIQPGSIRGAYHLGVVGALDPNYRGMRELDGRLERAGVAHRLILTGDRHAWPAVEVCSRALAWLELVAMDAGLRPQDEALIASVLEAEEAEAAALERERDLDWAAVAYAGAAPLARALRPASVIPRRLESLRTGKELARQHREEADRSRAERETLARFTRFLLRLRDDPTSDLPLEPMLHDLDLDRLARKGRTARGSKDRQMAVRCLASLSGQARTLGRTALDGGQPARARLLFETAIRASVLDPRFQNDTRVWLACACARSGDPGRGLELLRSAVAAGFDDAEFLQEEPCLAGMRARPEFQEILRALADGLAAAP